MANRYAFQGYDSEKMVGVIGRDLAVSTKDAIEVCAFLKGKKLQRAKSIMQDVIDKKAAVPFKRFTNGAGHRRGDMAAGKYPLKAAEECLALLESLESNAQNKGMSTSDFIIIHACANKASRPPRYGRHRGRLAKRSHIEFIAAPEEADAGAKVEK